MLKQALLAFALMTGAAHATCGPQLEFNLGVGERDTTRSHALIGTDLYDSEEYGTRTRNLYGASEDANDNVTAGIKLKISLGEDYCEEQESAQLFRARENARSVNLSNIERTLKLCKQYGDNHPLLEGKCK